MKTITVKVNDATLTAYQDEHTGFYVVSGVGVMMEGYAMREATNSDDSVTRNFGNADDALEMLDSWVRSLIVQ